MRIKQRVRGKIHEKQQIQIINDVIFMKEGMTFIQNFCLNDNFKQLQV